MELGWRLAGRMIRERAHSTAWQFLSHRQRSWEVETATSYDSTLPVWCLIAQTFCQVHYISPIFYGTSLPENPNNVRREEPIDLVIFSHLARLCLCKSPFRECKKLERDEASTLIVLDSAF